MEGIWVDGGEVMGSSKVAHPLTVQVLPTLSLAFWKLSLRHPSVEGEPGRAQEFSPCLILDLP